MIEDENNMKKKEMEEEMKKKEKSHKLFLERKEYYHNLTNPEHYIQESLLKTEVKKRQKKIKAMATGKKEVDSGNSNNDTIKSRKSMNETKDDFGDDSGGDDDVGEESKNDGDNNGDNNNTNNGDDYEEEDVNKKIDLKYIPPEVYL